MAHTHSVTLTRTWTKVHGLSMHARLATCLAPPLASTVVLVHGLSVSSGYMVPTAEQLAPYFHVYAPDLPGFGKSAKPSHSLSVSELADALVAWMQAMELPPAILLGNSLGCQVIVHSALRYPEYITHAVLVGPTMDPNARTLHQAALRLLLDVRGEPLSYLPVLLREYLVAGLPRTIRTLQYACADRMEEHLPQVQVPTLIVRGSRDPIVSQGWAEEVTRLLPNSQMVVMPGVGHAVNFNAPRQLVQSMRSFLSE